MPAAHPSHHPNPKRNKMPNLTHTATWNQTSGGTVTLTAVFQLEATGRSGDPTPRAALSAAVTAIAARAASVHPVVTQTDTDTMTITVSI
jgi:hypothetical protein